MLHYNPQRVSSSTLLIFRRTNCIITTSGIVTLCKRPYSMPVESGMSALNRHTVRSFTESDDTRGCNNTICPPEDEQGTARNMLRIRRRKNQRMTQVKMFIHFRLTQHVSGIIMPIVRRQTE